MDELRQLASELLETEKLFLLEEKVEYRTAVVVVVAPRGAVLGPGRLRK
jgi:hypothetical protein